jgi:hypothetical protein
MSVVYALSAHLLTGEIDIIEAINGMGNNQMAIHTTSGCKQSASKQQLGASIAASDCSLASGCTVAEKKNPSYGPGFTGGVWATYFDTTGVSIWYWPVSLSL